MIKTKIIILLSIGIIYLTLDIINTFSTQTAFGLDGYYYIIQINSVKKTGHFYYPTLTPLMLYFLTGLSLIIGNTLVGIKIGIILLQYSLYLSVFSLIKSVTNYWLGFLAFCICGISSLHFYLTVEYLNYLGAISFLLWSSFFIINFLKTRKKIFLFGGLICLVITIGSHISMIAIIPLMILITALFWWFLKAINIGNKIQIIISSMTLLLFSLSPVLLVAQPFFSIPITWQKEIITSPEFPTTLSMLPEILILTVVSPFVLFIIIYWKKNNTDIGVTLLGVISFWSILITLNPFITSDLGFTGIGGRIRLLAFIQVAILVPGIIWLLKDKFRFVHWYILIITIPLMIWSFFQPLPRGAQSDYLDRRSRLIEGLKLNSQEIDSQSIIIAEHGEEFVVTAIIKIPSQQSFPKEKNYKNVYWLLNLVPPTLIDPSMNIIAKDKVGFYTVIIKDDEIWQQKLQNLTTRNIFRNSNRHLNNYLLEKNIY